MGEVIMDNPEFFKAAKELMAEANAKPSDTMFDRGAVEKICELYRAGITVHRMAEKFGVEPYELEMVRLRQGAYRRRYYDAAYPKAGWP